MKKRTPIIIMTALLAAVCLAALSFGPANAVQVVPVPDDTIQPVQDSQLDRIEGKLDKVLANTEKTVEQLDGLKEANNANALLIVDAIKSSQCPDCPTEPPKPADAKPDTVQNTASSAKVVVKYRSVSSPRWRINGVKWTRASLTQHLLNHDNHAGTIDKKTLDAMSLPQMWAYHDDLHDAQVLDVVPVPGGPSPSPGGGCPGGVCPPRGQMRAFPLMRRWLGR